MAVLVCDIQCDVDCTYFYHIWKRRNNWIV